MCRVLLATIVGLWMTLLPVGCKKPPANAGAATFDCALLMRDIRHEWHAGEALCGW